MRLSGLLVIVLLAVTACAAMAASAPAQPTYYVMRHLEKATGTDPGLTEIGRTHAAQLPALLADAPPAVIYVSTTRRARETAAPLAAALRLTPREYSPTDTPALVARVRAETGTVLIVGHSNTVPDIIEQLGGTRPADIPEDRFGDLWRIGAGGVTMRTTIDEH